MADEQGAAPQETYDPHAGIEKWLRLWREQHLFEAGDLTPASAKDEQRTLVVSMFPYPSGDLHMGHAEVYSISDTMARYARLRGQQVLNPIAWDSFGLPAENAARKRGLDARVWTYGNIEIQAESFERLGISFDWRTRFHTSDPEYYRWNQWLFLRMFERNLAYRRAAPVNWCPTDETVLANEQVIQGKCERCGTEVIKRNLTQWFFRTTDYAQRLLDDMQQLEGNWPDEILSMQRNWIGRSTGAYIDFTIQGRTEPVRVFSTRPDTIYGATFFVVAADSSLAEELCAPEHVDQLQEYRAGLVAKPEQERLAVDRPMTGVFLGRHAVNPMNGELLPIYASDYVLADYGTGAVMAVPAHDQRDLNFARTFDLPVRVVVDTGEADPVQSGTATAGDGVLVNSGPLDGLAKQEAIAAVNAELEERGLGKGAVTYRLRDWLLSRQRFWGTPIPIIHCESCGAVPVPDDDLPVRLPETGYTLRPEGGKSPLETATAWVQVSCPSCHAEARRDTDTMDTFVDSSWYFLRFPNPHYEEGPFDPAGMAAWLPVDEYVGGKEHSTGHLMYARFLTKVLYDMELVPFTEPFKRLTNQGQVIMDGKAMSKSLGNLVNLQEQIAAYGPDAVRVTMLFASPPEDDIDWADVSPAGSVKWLARVWRLARDIGGAGPDLHNTPYDAELRKTIHRLIAETTQTMEAKRFNVAIARMMQLTNVLRQAVDSGPGPRDSAVQEGVEALARMLSCVAPFTAEECWSRLGHEPSVLRAGWPEADPALLIEDQVTCVVQVAGKVRDRLQVSPEISEEELRRLALDSVKVREALNGNEAAKVIVRAPKLVNIVPASN
ncbi:leucine--tRNA ligase [Kitasatospora acidiphila]|uniref:Leucine--tRNA ligase n=1 Tax=Kitasatospora acidiphila TaxID=2567942 RepID=A0A540VYZ6_9ACTN|nr:leucine--tRNA ligase [Kitasatospora acidiphila]TQF01963.1 leucine--tRNA ligase [Kitasatospora acidiphila]